MTAPASRMRTLALLSIIAIVGVRSVSLVSAQTFGTVDSSSCVMRSSGYGQFIIQGGVISPDGGAYVIVTATFYNEGMIIATGYSEPIITVLGQVKPFAIVTDVSACNAVTSYTLTSCDYGVAPCQIFYGGSST